MIIRISLLLLTITCANTSCLSEQRPVILTELHPQSELVVPVPTDKGLHPIGLFMRNDSPFLAYYSKNDRTLKLASVLDSQRISFELGTILDSTILNNERVLDIAILNKDSIVVLFDRHIVGIRRNAVFFVKDINAQVEGKWPHHTVYGFSGVSHMLYDASNQLIYVRVIAADIDKWKKAYYRSEILAAFHLTNKKLEVIKIFYPPYYTEHYVGDLSTYQILQYKGKLMVAFLAVNNGVLFNYITKETKVFDFPKSALDTETPVWFPWNTLPPIKERMNKIVENRIYDNVLVFHGKDLLRFFRTGIPLTDSAGGFNTKLDKRITLQRLNNELETIDEFYLPDEPKYDSYYSFVVGNKLFINSMSKDAKDRSNIHFDVFDLDSL